jgi:hypothetical protein
MKNLICSGLLVVTILLLKPDSYSQKVASYQSKWHPGLVKDQEEQLINQMQLDEKSQFLFLISNDGQNLFVDLVTADRAAVQKIMRYGLTTWINPEGKHKKTIGIEFPVTSEGQAEPGFMRDKNADRKDMRMAMMDSKNKEMVLIGFGEKNERRVIDPRNDKDFQGKVEMMEGGKLRVSLVVPLEKIHRTEMAMSANPVSLGFETGYMDVTGQGMSSGGGQQSGGGMQGGGGMPGGGPPMGGQPSGGGAQGSMSGGSDQQNRPDISEMASPSKLWIKQVTLAEKP